MKKSIHLAFIAVMAILILLIVGNLATPVYANNANISTPTQTGTPMTEPESRSGDLTSKEQKELKAVIKSYFEMRYQLLSISNHYGLRPEGFSNLVSHGADAKAFLDVELGKLAVESKHAELNHLRYVKYEYFLDFINITFDTFSQIATVSMIEENETIDEISMELAPEDPFVSHRYNLEHIIVLRREQGQWKIVSDNYTDYFWRLLRQDKISVDELLSNMEALPRPLLQSKSGDAMTASPLPPNDTSVHTYDGDGAADYAVKHANNYNPNYPRYDSGPDALAWGDCTNFVSQAIYEGGNASMFIPSPLPNPDIGGNGWYLINNLQRAKAWTHVEFFHTFVTSESWNEAYPGGEWFGQGPQGYEVAINELRRGDVIQYDWTGNGSWDHAAIVVDIVGTDPFVATHSPDDIRHYTAFSPSYDPNLTQLRYIHIERSNGNTPVKADIQGNPFSGQSSDDAGTNPSNCTFSPTDNEVYLGSCSNNSGDIASGFQFRNIQIPQGAFIKYAYLIFAVDGPYDHINDPIVTQIYGETDTTPEDFVFSPLETRQTTDNAVLWVLNQPIDNWVLHFRHAPPAITTIVQEIVNSPDWNPQNNIANTLSFIFKNVGSTKVRRIIAYERAIQDGQFSPAKLIVAYSLEDPAEGRPTVESITRANANPTNAATVRFNVKFSEPVTGVNLGLFRLTSPGLSNPSIIGGEGQGSEYVIDVDTGSGNGALRLDLIENADIKDLESNPLYGGFTNGQTYTINKTAITISGNTGTGDASLSYFDGMAKSVTANTSGDYSFTVPYGWSGMVTPSKVGYTFSPVSKSYSSVSGDQSGQNYTPTLNLYTISGNAGVGGATLSYVDGTTKTVTANSSGDYSFAVSYGWSGTVTPSRAGYTFVPANRPYASISINQTGQNYTATPVLLTISGNLGIGGATLRYVDGSPKTATADASGNYSFTVPYNWSGTVTPSKVCYAFSPANGNYINVVGNQPGQNYTAQPCGDTAGIFRSNGLVYLKNSNSGSNFDLGFTFGGLAGDYPVAGDWDGNGTTTIGIYRNGSFLLRNSNSSGYADHVFGFGMPGDQPIAGDWNGDGIDTIGVYRSSNFTFYLRNSNSQGPVEMTFSLGLLGWTAITGDWNGDGLDTTGVFKPTTGQIYLKNSNTTGFADIEFNFGIAGDKPLTGDWDSNGIDTIGVYRNGMFYLRNSHTAGFADITFAFGIPGDMPIAGNWDGLPTPLSMMSGSICIMDFDGWLIEPGLSDSSVSLDTLDMSSLGCDVYLSPEEALEQGISLESVEVISEPLVLEQVPAQDDEKTSPQQEGR